MICIISLWGFESVLYKWIYLGVLIKPNSFSFYLFYFAEIPDQKPILNGIHIRYRSGDVVRGNCSSYYSKPAANLTWTINDTPVRFFLPAVSFFRSVASEHPFHSLRGMDSIATYICCLFSS